MDPKLLVIGVVFIILILIWKYMQSSKKAQELKHLRENRVDLSINESTPRQVVTSIRFYNDEILRHEAESATGTDETREEMSLRQERELLDYAHNARRRFDVQLSYNDDGKGLIHYRMLTEEEISQLINYANPKPFTHRVAIAMKNGTPTKIANFLKVYDQLISQHAFMSANGTREQITQVDGVIEDFKTKVQQSVNILLEYNKKTNRIHYKNV